MTPTLYQCPTCHLTAVAHVPPRTPPMCRSRRHPTPMQMNQINETGEPK